MENLKTKYLTRKEVASRYSVNISTLWRWTVQGDFPKPVQLGGRVKRWSLQELESFEARLANSLNIER